MGGSMTTVPGPHSTDIAMSILLALAILFCSTLAWDANADECDDVCYAEMDVESCEEVEQSTWLRSEFLYWNPHIRSVDYASTEDGSSLAIGAGGTHRVGFDQAAGFRVGIGHMTKAGWAVGFDYTDFSTSGEDRTERPGGIGQLFSTLSHPGGPEEADLAIATTSLDFATYDLTAATRVVDKHFRSIDVFAGLRWATIDHELNADFDGRDFVNGEINDRMELNAFGMMFGAEGHWRMAEGWFLFGRSSLAAMYGDVRNTRIETNLNGFEQLVDFQDEYTTPLFNVETRLGIAKSLGCFELRFGYDFNIWTGIGNRIRFSDDIEETAYAPADGDMLLEGLFFQLATSW